MSYAVSGGDRGTTRFDIFANDDPSDFDAHVRTHMDYGDGEYSDYFYDSTAIPLRYGSTTSHACAGHDVAALGPVDGSPSHRIEAAPEHAYRKPGRYTAHLVVETGTGDRVEVATLDKTVAVAPKRVQSNGPESEMDVQFDRAGQFRDGGDQTFLWDPKFCDPDGWISSVRVDWGDGSPPTVVDRGLDGCVDPGNRFPTSQLEEHFSHRYAKPGDYQIDVAVRSSGCDGGDVQNGGEGIGWVVK
jgi:hypothetical protein